ncbi:hypothetical protein GALL_475780 [mine drainage metagenome]|uniref:Uncharacterized protein n=1 Tax=mine drainage metagenome TaxID=410659 RepID=A0A1J5PSV3_9ZZZZ
MEHVADQRGLAAARHPCDRDHRAERNLHVDSLQIVFARAFENQPRRGQAALRVALECPASRQGIRHLPRPIQILPGQGTALQSLLHRALEHDPPAALTRSGADLDHPVGRTHELRIVLDHQQRIARILQPRQHAAQAVEVARVQPDRRFVEHEQRLRQRRAQRRRQVDALHFPPGQGARLPVEGQIAQPDVAQIAQPGAEIVEQHGAGGPADLAQFDPGEQPAQPLDRQRVDVVQRQPGKLLQSVVAPLHPDRPETGVAVAERGVRLFTRASPPQQRLGLELGAAAGRTGGVAAVLGQQHPDVHFVSFGFQVLKKAFDSKPVLTPLAVPVRRAVDHPMLLLGREPVPGRVTRNALGLGVAHQVLLCLFPGRRLDRLDGPGAQRQPVVGNHQPVIDTDHPAKTTAAGAGTDRRVEGEHRGDRFGVAQIAFRTVQTGRKAPYFWCLRYY